jgi:hypothetical protein
LSDKNEEILERIAKLLEVSDRNKRDGFIAEAENAAALATKLITRYQLDQAEVETYASKSREDRQNPMTSELVDPEVLGIKTYKRKIAWRAQLGVTVAEACAVKSSTNYKHNRTRFIGRQTDVKAAAYIYTYLLRALEEAANQHMKKEFVKVRTYPDGRREKLKVKGAEKTKIRNTFLLGAVIAIDKKVKLYRQQAVNGFSNPERALLFLDSREKAARDFAINELKIEKSTSKYTSLENLEAYQQALGKGYEHGRDKIHLHQVLEGGKNPLGSLQGV